MNGTKYDLGTAAQQFYKGTCLLKKRTKMSFVVEKYMVKIIASYIQN